MNTELINLSKKTANSLRYIEEYSNVVSLIDLLVQQCEFQEKEYKKAKETIEFIMGSQKFCMMCNNLACKNGTTGEVSCSPIWNGDSPWKK